MGKKIRDEDLKLNVIVNGDPAKKELGDLEVSTRELKDENKALRLEKKKLNKEDKDYKDNLRKINQAISENNVKISENENRMDQLRNTIGLTGMTYSQLRREYQKLKILQSNTTYGTPQWKKLDAQLKKVGARMQKVRSGATASHFSIKKMADGFNRYFGIVTAGVATITGVIFSIKQWIQGNVGLSDSLADVMKTTGMTRKEVRELYTEFRYLNTRTARGELLKLAEEAGRLGKKSKKDVMDFVEVANQIKVALGDDLGGEAEVAIREVGKLTEIFGVGEKYGVGFRKSMLMVGSAINEVSANSQAQAPYLIDMMKRLAGIATQANITSDQVIGYAAVLDEKGQRVEMASTAMGKTIISMFKDTGEYANIAGMNVSDFTDLLNEDANEAFIKVLEGLNGNNEGLSVMAAKLDALGIDGARAVQVLASLAGATDKIRERQKLANNSLLEATSLTKEYNTKNENLAGNVERIGRAVRAWFINSELISFLERTVSWMSKIVEVPVEEKFEREREAANRLAIELTKPNLKEKERLKLLEQLRDISPDITKGIEAERIEIGKLFDNLEKYNEAIANKIVLAQLDQKEQELLNKAGENRAVRLSLENDILLKVKEVNREIIETKESLEERTKAAIDLLVEEGASIEEFTKKSDIYVNKSGQRIDNRSEEQKLLDEILLIASRRNKLLDEENEMMGDVQSFQKRAQAIRELMQIQTGSASEGSSSESNGDSPGDEDGINEVTKTLSPDIPTIEERFNAVKTLMDQSLAEAKNKLLVSREDGKLTQEQYNQELNILELAHLESLLAARREAGMETVDLENSILEKKISILDKEMAAKAKAAEAEKKLEEEKQKIIENQIKQRELEVKMAVTSAASAVENAKTIGEAGKAILEAIRQQIKAYIAEATAKAVGKALVQVPFPFNIALGAAAGAAVSALFNSIIPQFEKGLYPVQGADDHKTYMASFIDSPGTGLLESPTILAGEKPEIIIDPKTTRNLQMNYPGVIQAIMAARVPQYASGSYPRELVRESRTIEKPFVDPAMANALNRFADAVDKMQREGIPARMARDYDNAYNLTEFLNEYNETLNDVKG